MFNLYDNDRLITWRRFRDSLEKSETPFTDVAEFWSRAPFVNPYLNPNQPATWPDPWRLVIDGKYDDLAICLGMLYTIKLTQRFTDSNFEIHMSMLSKDHFYLVVDNKHVLNYEPRIAHDLKVLQELQTSKMWHGDKLP